MTDHEISMEVESGRIQGLFIDGVHRYLGVPYAAAPFGENRFRPPQPVQSWSGERDCRHPGATAPQLPYAGGMEKFLGSTSVAGEEILNLAIWAPERTSAELAPVIVWIHGGSLTRGMTVVDWHGLWGRAPNADVAIEIDAPLLRPSSAVALLVVTLYS